MCARLIILSCFIPYLFAFIFLFIFGFLSGPIWSKNQALFFAGPADLHARPKSAWPVPSRAFPYAPAWPPHLHGFNFCLFLHCVTPCIHAQLSPDHVAHIPPMHIAPVTHEITACPSSRYGSGFLADSPSHSPAALDRPPPAAIANMHQLHPNLLAGLHCWSLPQTHGYDSS